MPRHKPTDLVNPITTDINYTVEELEFIKAMERYRRTQRRTYPTCREVLAIALSLGYRKVAAPADLPAFVRGGTGKKRKKPPAAGKEQESHGGS